MLRPNLVRSEYRGKSHALKHDFFPIITKYSILHPPWLPFRPKEFLILQELAISNTWELKALVEILEKKGLTSNQEFLYEIHELCKRNPNGRTLPEFDDSKGTHEQGSR